MDLTIKAKKSSGGSMVTKKRSQLTFYILGLAWPVLQFCIFYIYINFNSFMLAFQRYEYGTGYLFNGLANFKQLFSDFQTNSIFLISTKNSIELYFINLIFGPAAALLFSYYIFKNKPGSMLFKIFLYLPNILGGVVLTIMFKFFADNAVPEIARIFSGAEIQGLLANNDTKKVTIIFFCLWTGFGTSVLLYSSAMSGISDSVLEAAQLDGITPLRELVCIIIPYIWSTFVTFFVTSVVGIFTNQMNLYTFFGENADYGLYTFGYYLFRSVRMASFVEYPYLAALGLLMTAVAVPLTLFSRWALTKYGPKDN